MANKQYLNYDPDTNQLYLCDNCETNPVYTKTSFNEDSLSVRDDDCLYMKDVDGQVHKISNSLRGPAGTDGKDGKDGEKGADGLDALLPHHLELSNDMDQVYVNANNVVETTQTITTDVALYLGDDLISFYTDYDKSEGTKVWKLYDGEPKSDDSNLVVGNKIAFEFTEGQKIKDPIFVKQIYAVLEINNLKSREIIKDFKIKRLQGAEDYDLLVSPTILKIASDTELNKSAQINVKIKKRTLGLTSSVSYITDLSENGLPAGLAVKYKFNNGKEQVVSDDGIIQIDDTSTLDLTNKYTISLYRNDEVIDQATIECVKDGRNGETSKHIELSDEWDQVYTTEGKTKIEQKYHLIASYYEGSSKEEISDKSYSFSGSLAEYVDKDKTSIINGSVLFCIIIPANTELSSGKTQKLTVTYNDAKQDFTLITLEGKYDYDLVVTPGNMSLPAENYTYEDIIIKIRRKEIGAKSSESEFVELPNGYSLSAMIDGEDANEWLVQSEDKQSYCISGQTLALDKPKIVTITLLNDGTIIDSSEVAILYDGSQGPRGKDGASAYFLDFSNDYDQIYYSNEEPNKQVYSSTIENIITLYKGSEILNLPEDTTISITSNIDETGTIEYIDRDVVDGKVKLTFNISNDSISVNKIKDLKSITYNINIQATVTDNEQEDINITKLFKLAVIEGDEDYDLQVSRTTIRKDGNGFLIDKTPIDVEVWYRLFTGTHTKHTPVENLAWLYEKGLSLKCSIDGGTPTDLLVIEQIDTDIQQAAENYVMLYLTKGQDIVDYVRLDVARDGATGKDASGWILDLSNDTDQLLHQEGVTDWQLIISTEIRVFKETKLLATSNYTIEPIYPDSVDEAWCTLTSMDTYYLFTMDVPEGTEIISGLNQIQILFMVTVSEEDINLNKYLNIHVIQGTDDFDLLLSKYSIKSSGSQIVDVGGLEVWVRKTTRLGGSISKTNLYASGVQDEDHWATSGLSIIANAYKGSDSALECNINDLGIIDTSLISDYDRIVITLKLNGETIDEETVQIVRDGSSYYLELENEYDQINIQNSKVFGNLTVSVEKVTLYNGGSIINNFSIEWSETSSEGVTLNTNGKSASITYKDQTPLNSDSTYTLIAKVNGSQVATAKFTVIAVVGSTLYDLKVNKTVFNKDSAGNLKDDGKLSIEVIKTDLKTSDVKALSVAKWGAENIEVKISIDGGANVQINTKEYSVENINKEAVVSLLHNGKLVDQVRIEVVSDGYTPEITQKPNGVIEIKSSPTTDPVALNPDIRYVTLAFSFADSIDNVDSRWAIYAGDQYDQASMDKVMPYPENGIDSSAIYVFRQTVMIPFYYIKVDQNPMMLIYDYDGQHDSWKTLFESIILDEANNKFPDGWEDWPKTSDDILDVNTASKNDGSLMQHVIEHVSFPLVKFDRQNPASNATILRIKYTPQNGCVIGYVNKELASKTKTLQALTEMLMNSDEYELTYTDSKGTVYKVTPCNIGIFKNLHDLVYGTTSNHELEIGLGSGVLGGFQKSGGHYWLNLKELNEQTKAWKSHVF